MPSNSTSTTSCSIYPIDHPSLPTGLPCHEYKHHTMKSTITGAIQEIVIIESSQGTSFEISLDIKPTAYAALHQATDQPASAKSAPLKEDDYLIYVLLDGINAQRSKRHHSQRGPTRISGVYAQDRSSSRSFQFGTIQLVDPDDHPATAENPADRICEDEKIIQALGTIQVNIVRCTLGSPHPLPRRSFKSNHTHRSASSRCASDLRTTNQMKFSERSKKACQLNTAGLSQPMPITNGGRSGGGTPFAGKKSVRPIVREDPHPFLQFIFKYKARAILEAEGIIAPPPPPPPSPPCNSSVAKLKTTRRSSSKNSTPIKPGLSHQHDYQSNSELHKSSHNSKAKNDPDEKKPKAQGKSICINIDSDSDSNSREKRGKKAHPRTVSNPTNGELSPKPESRDCDNNNRNSLGNAAVDSKKRARSITVDVKPNSKRASIGNGPPSNASTSRANGHNMMSQVHKTETKENIATHAPPRNTTTSNAGNNQYRYNDSPYLEDSSDDDDKFKSKILAAAPDPSTHSARLSIPNDHHLSKGTKKPSPQSLNHLNIHRPEPTASHQRGPNFFDLTGTDDESD